MSKWDRFRDTVEGIHRDFEFPEATFENWTGSTYNPDTGQMEGGTWTEIGRAEVELVPPSVDSTASVESGTTLEFDTSLRLPKSSFEDFNDDIVPYDADSQKPTRVAVEGTEYEVMGNVPEHGSGLVLLRVTEI